MQWKLTVAGISLGAIALQVLPAYAFSDVSSSTSYNQAIEALESRGVVEGYADGSFKPTATINRAEFLKIILEARDGTQTFSGSDCFPDVQNQWFAPYVCTALNEEIIEGYPDGTFKPEQPISFVEAAKIISLAYDQQITEQSSLWYEGFARALEGSKAIPPSIDRLEQPITRAEMAEMMWRISEGKTDQTTKGYLNVKYPELSVNTVAVAPQRAESCRDLQAFARESQASQHYDYALEEGGVLRGQGAVPPTAGAPAPMGESADSATAGLGGGSDGDFSKTNVQVEGVDEADIVKTDGEYIYTIRNRHLSVVRAVPAADMTLVADINFEDASFSPNELYIDGSRIIVIGSSWVENPRIMEMEKRASDSRIAMPDIWPGWRGSRTEVRIYQFDGGSLTEERKISLEGNQVSTRKIDGKLYLVMNENLYHAYPMPYIRGEQPQVQIDDDALVPHYEDSAYPGKRKKIIDCDDVLILPRVPHPQYLIVSVIPTDQPKGIIHSQAILGNGQNVYASLENLYVAATNWEYDWRPSGGTSRESTDVYRFAMTGDGIAYAAQGQVPGRILNQFSMDEHGPSFRIATTTGHSWNGDEPSMNHLFILNRSMETVGRLEDMAPGEQIYSVRFVGDRAYVVTFKQVDPLFVIDTSNPRNPTILGKLKIPGYSDYLHPYDEDHIIGFGKDAVAAKDENFAWYQGMKIALFDVSDVSNPRELHSVSIGDRGTESPLLHNHKALLFEKDRDLLAFPIRINEIDPEVKQHGEPGSAYGSPVFQGAQVYTLTPEDGFTLRGQITHYTNADYQKAGEYFYGKDVERIVRIGDTLYTLSQAGVKASDEQTIEQEGIMSYQKPQADSGSCGVTTDTKKYVSLDTEECTRILFMCEQGWEPFTDRCGCGCQQQ